MLSIIRECFVWVWRVHPREGRVWLLVAVPLVVRSSCFLLKLHFCFCWKFPFACSSRKAPKTYVYTEPLLKPRRKGPTFSGSGAPHRNNPLKLRWLIPPSWHLVADLFHNLVSVVTRILTCLKFYVHASPIYSPILLLPQRGWLALAF